MAWVETALGVAMEPGGRHETMGTHNALLRLSRSSYLEVIAIDPEAPSPARPRWFGLDALSPVARPRLTTWVVRSGDPERTVAASSVPLGEVLRMARGSFRWRITVPNDGSPPLDGLLPAVIAWSSEHPAKALPDRGCRLAGLEARLPDPDTLRGVLDDLEAQGCAIVPVAPGDPPRLVAIIETPRGLCRLGGAA